MDLIFMRKYTNHQKPDHVSTVYWLLNVSITTQEIAILQSYWPKPGHGYDVMTNSDATPCL